MLTNAFDIKDYQLQAPDWVDSERFIVTAKIPPNTTKEQFRLMLQRLLAERFQLQVHHESKEHAVYALVVAKGGSKLKESDPNDTSGIAPPPGARPGIALGGGGGGDGGGRKGGPPAGGPGAGRGGMMSMGRGHLEAKRMKVDGLANMLSNLAGKPVVDQTELKGIYDFKLDFAPDSVEGSFLIGGPPPPPPPGGGERAERHDAVRGTAAAIGPEAGTQEVTPG
jgi:uncharacterized protein (TIGR03435 family)